MSLLDAENVRMIDVQDEKASLPVNDLNRLREIEQEKNEQKLDNVKPKKYNWAFFCASMFIGLGIGINMENPSAMIIGMGVGFLFFVDPIYQKIMSKIDKW